MKKPFYRTMVAAAAAGLLLMGMSHAAWAFPSQGGSCQNCHNDGAGSLTASPDPIKIKIGENGLLTFDVTALPATGAGNNNMIALEDLTVAGLDASIGTEGDNWSQDGDKTKSDQNIGLGEYVLDLEIGANAVLGSSYQLVWYLAGGGDNDDAMGTSGMFTVDVIPEPATLALWGLGAAGLVVLVRRRRRHGCSD